WTPRALIHGPRPIRSRALTAGAPAAAGALRYARHRRSPRPTAAARCRQMSSAPASPARLPPKPRPVLVMKNDIAAATAGASWAVADALPSSAITTRLHARKPVEPEVGVDAAGALPEAGHGVDDLNRAHELEVLVAALPFDTQAERRAVAGRQVASVQAVGQDRLRVRHFEEIVSFVPSVPRVYDRITSRRQHAAR